MNRPLSKEVSRQKRSHDTISIVDRVKAHQLQRISFGIIPFLLYYDEHMDLHSPFVTLLSGLFTGLVASYIAKRRQKNLYLWFGIGFLFGLLGLFVLFFVSKKRKPTPSLQESPPLPPDLKGPKDKLWYYVNTMRNPEGPFSHSYLNSLWKTGKIDRTTYVWNEEMKDWQELNNFLDQA